MKTYTLSAITAGKTWVGLGIAGNQAEHLDQAGEAEDFKDIVTQDNAPKGIFPWFIPNSDSFLAINPLSDAFIVLNGNDPLQPEPEVSLIVKIQPSAEQGKLIEAVDVVGFSIFNDCSRRITAPKISIKKNWGEASQGMADLVIGVNDFETSRGSIENYRIACYLKRDDHILQYGKNTAVSDYCYVNTTLTDWIVEQLNTQTNTGPLEPVGEMIAKVNPEYAVIAIGATCYSDFGNSNDRFLREGDEIYVALYHQESLDESTLEKQLKEGKTESNEDCLFLHQKAVVSL